MVTRPEFLAAGAAAFGAAWPSGTLAQTPKRGGTLVLRAWDPPHFDHSLVHAYKTHVVISFTHSRLLRHRAGADVRPGSLILEGDVAESWQQPTDTTYVFKLRKGVRFHDKPPVKRSRAERRGREVHVPAHARRDGQQRLHVPLDCQDRGAGPVHGPVHAVRAVCVVPRYGRKSHGRWHRCPGARREVRRPQEAGGVDQLGEGARYYRHDPAEAKRLLAATGYPKGFPASVCFNSYGSTVLVDTVQLVLKHLKAVGIDARLDQKEYGAYQATCRLGKFDSMVFGPLTPFLEPDNFLFGQYYVGESRNRSPSRTPGWTISSSGNGAPWT
jgi:ABC-type transport system substrate-binding protein